MTEQLRCKHCGLIEPVIIDDPDASVADMVDHVAIRHGIREDLAISMVIEIEDAPADVENRRQP